jgi:hypothetical protein
LALATSREALISHPLPLRSCSSLSHRSLSMHVLGALMPPTPTPSFEARRTTSMPPTPAWRIGGRICMEAWHGSSTWHGAPSPYTRRRRRGDEDHGRTFVSLSGMEETRTTGVPSSPSWR